jgi:hypothetical protein
MAESRQAQPVLETEFLSQIQELHATVVEHSNGQERREAL